MKIEQIPGLYYVANYITQDEESELMTYFTSTKEWKGISKHQSSRQVIQYGYDYPYDSKSTIKKTEAIPQFLLDLVKPERVNKIINEELLKTEMEQLIINKYEENQKISPHIDHVKYFGDVIVCITLGHGTDAIFTQNNKQIKIPLAKNSIYIMSDDARYKWTHEMKQITGKRISLTYRTIVDKYK